LTSRPPRLAVQLDGKLWYEGHAYIVAIANGQTFGHGMRVAPNAVYNDGLFDVILVEGMPRTRIVMALNTVSVGASPALRRSFCAGTGLSKSPVPMG